MLQFKRGKRKVLADYKLKDLYNYYSSEVKDPVDKETYKRVLGKIYPEIIKMIIFENMEFYFPNRLGTFRIKKKLTEVKLTEEGEVDVRALSIDWKKTKALWVEMYPDKKPKDFKAIKDKPLIRELNEHTDGWRYTWYWDRFTSNIPHQSYYTLDLNREYDRLLSKAAKTINNLEYYK